MYKERWGFVRKCPTCGKKFDFLTLDWAYQKPDRQKGRVYYCSWKCLRASEANKPRKQQPTEIGQKIIEMLKQGKRWVTIAETLNVERSQIQYWRDRMEVE